MAAGRGPSLASQFSELMRLGEQSDYEKALRVANKIVQDAPNDIKAFQCKLVCLIHLGKFEDALTCIRKADKFSSAVMFEKAYCEYRLNRTDEALRTIQSVQQPDNRLKELLGQVLYRMEEYKECYSTYRDLVRNLQDDYEEERETNLSAVLASMQLWSDSKQESMSLRENTHELSFNHACFLIGKNKYKEALEKLETAEDLCRKAFEEDADSSKEDMEAELSVIWAQQGYVLQQLGQSEAAMKLYTQVVKLRPSDAALVAVASNNIVTLNKEQNVFDSKKKLKLATADALKHKLSACQRQVIAVNECLLHLHSGQADQCHKASKLLQKTETSSVTAYLIEAAQFVKEKNYDKATQLLEEELGRVKGEGPMLRLRLALSQVYLMQESAANACKALRQLDKPTLFSPGMVSTLVGLYVSEGDVKAGGDLLREAIDWHRNNNKTDEQTIDTLLRAHANFHLVHGEPRQAALSLEELRVKDSNNLKILARLISAYSKFDSSKAHSVSKQLPSVEYLSKSVNVEELESGAGLLGAKYVKKTTRPEPSPAHHADRVTDGKEVVQKKKKRKRKKLLPKNYDPSVTPDPERWLPLRERSTYRGKRRNKKKDIGKGTQGSTATTSELDASKTSPPASELESPKSPGGGGGATTEAAGPRQSKPAGASAKQRPKKKKGSRW